MLCEYASCQESEKLPIAVSIRNGQERKRFCSEMHAAGWLLWRSKTVEQNLNRKMAAMACEEVLAPMRQGSW